MSRVVWLCVVPIEIFMRQLILWTACCAVVGWTNVVHSASNLLPDYSGVYACKGQWRFTKYYYQPEYKGGNHGFETCEQIKSGE